MVLKRLIDTNDQSCRVHAFQMQAKMPPESQKRTLLPYRPPHLQTEKAYMDLHHTPLEIPSSSHVQVQYKIHLLLFVGPLQISFRILE
mmetsp:Transcript_6247/g.9748  ORF Transcript_6247/g.9748 Transcript_6247/m.9748 type:complete len:88 (-) Transcript_6247:83-346(-)